MKCTHKSRRMAAAFLAVCLALTVSACGTRPSESESAATEEAAGQKGQEGEEKAMGRYMESSVSLPEGADCLGRAVHILPDGSFAYFDASVGLYVSKNEGADWQQEGRLEDVLGEYADDYITGAAISDDKRLACIVNRFSEEGERELCQVILSDSDGLIRADGQFADGDWLCRLAFSHDGSLYAASLKGKVCSVDCKTGEVTQLFVAADGPETMAVLQDSLLVLHRYGVEIYDLKEKTLQEADSVLDDFVRENVADRLGTSSESVGADLIATEEGILYLAYRGGLFRHALYGSAMEQIIDGQYSSFGNPIYGICCVLSLDSGEFLLVTTKEEMLRFTYDPNEPTLPEKQLKLYSLLENTRLRQVISAYQEAHPEVFVSYEVGMPENTGLTLTDAVKNLNVKLMAGEGPDVILMDGLELNAYVQKGMLYDLTGILDGIGKEELFPKIAGAYRTEEGTFVIPTNFKLPLLFGKKEEIGQVRDLKTLADAVEGISQRGESGSVTGIMLPGRQLSVLSEICGQSWLSGDTLDTQALKDFLVQVRRICAADRQNMTDTERELFVEGSSYEGAQPIGSGTDNMMMGFAKMTYGCAQTVLADLGSIGVFYEDGDDYELKFLSGQGENGFVPIDQIAVTAETKQPELAEDFVKMMLSEEIQKVNLGSGFPVNRAALDALIEEQSGYWIGGSWGEHDFSHTGPGEKTAARFLELAEQADQIVTCNALLQETVLKYGKEVVEGRMDEDTAVTQIAREMAIYLAE